LTRLPKPWVVPPLASLARSGTASRGLLLRVSRTLRTKRLLMFGPSPPACGLPASADFCLPFGRRCRRPRPFHRGLAHLASLLPWGVRPAPGLGVVHAVSPARTHFLLCSTSGRQISQGKTRDFPLVPAAYTSPGPDAIGLRIPTPPCPPRQCLVCSLCSSGRGFACSFLPTRPRGRAVAVRLGVPSIKASRGLTPPSHFPLRFRSAVIQRLSALRAMPGARRVAPGGYPPGAPSDPCMRDYRTRLLMSQVGYGAVAAWSEPGSVSATDIAAGICETMPM
jgi:hypothetical protein